MAIIKKFRITSFKNEKPIISLKNISISFDNHYQILDSISLDIQKGQVLGLLGPNGAGKTTAISMLCGLFEPTNGNAFVDNQSITNTKELQNIHTSMGVCPQHDVLWSDLTAREHLLFYGRLKGLTGGVLINEVVEVLKDVKLTFAADKQCGKYSGKLNERLIF